jgi:hypothetical protein
MRFQGKVALVDDSDFEYLSQFDWQVSFSGWHWYATSRLGDSQGSLKSMHRLLFGFPARTQIDHIDRNTLNNQRGNLRVATPSQTGANSIARGGSSRFKGVTWDKNRSLWSARLRVHPLRLALGRFEFEGDAAKAYDAAARKFFGEFARVNFPDPDQEGKENMPKKRRKRRADIALQLKKLSGKVRVSRPKE